MSVSNALAKLIEGFDCLPAIRAYTINSSVDNLQVEKCLEINKFWFASAQYPTPAKFNSRYLSSVSRMDLVELHCFDNTNVVWCISRHNPHNCSFVEALLLVIRSILVASCLHINDGVASTNRQLSNVTNVQREVAANDSISRITADTLSFWLLNNQII